MTKHKFSIPVISGIAGAMIGSAITRRFGFSFEDSLAIPDKYALLGFVLLTLGLALWALAKHPKEFSRWRQEPMFGLLLTLAVFICVGLPAFLIAHSSGDETRWDATLRILGLAALATGFAVLVIATIRATQNRS